MKKSWGIFLIFAFIIAALQAKGINTELLSLKKLSKERLFVLNKETFDVQSRSFKSETDNRKVFRIKILANEPWDSIPFSADDFPNLQELSFDSQDIPLWKDLKTFSKLQVLTLLTDDGRNELFSRAIPYSSVLEPIWHLSNLKKLTLQLPLGYVGEDILKLEKLEYLYLNVLHIDFPVLNRLPKLKHVNINVHSFPGMDECLAYQFGSTFIKNYNKTIKYVDDFGKTLRIQRLDKECLSGGVKANSNANGEVLIKHENNKVAMKGYLKNGHVDSVWSFYNSEGQLLGLKQYSMGKPVGKTILYYPFDTASLSPFNPQQIVIVYSDIYKFNITGYTKYGKVGMVITYRDAVPVLFELRTVLAYGDKRIVELRDWKFNGKQWVYDEKGKLIRIDLFKNNVRIEVLCEGPACESYK